jgi:hypothetical protein
MTNQETPEHLPAECQSSHILHAEHGRRIVGIKQNHCQASEILLHIALIGWQSAAVFWNTQPIRRCGQPLDFRDLERDLVTDFGQ